MDIERMVENIPDAKEREAARALLMPKKLTPEEKAARSARLRANREMIEAREAKHREELSRQLTDIENEQDARGVNQEQTQDLTPEQHAFLTVNLNEQRSIGRAKARPPEDTTRPQETTQRLTQEEQAELDENLRRFQGKNVEKTNTEPPKKASFFSLKRWFN